MGSPSLHQALTFDSMVSFVIAHDVMSSFLAIQMWTLGRFLPLAIGHLVQEDNEFWINFLCLLDIMDIIFARNILKVT